MNTGVRNAAIICLTEKGAKLALFLAKDMAGVTVYMPERLSLSGDNVYVNYFTDWHNAFKEAFYSSSQLICIMAAGIVVRSLAPLIVSKYSDPAVVVVDENGSYVISMLSGHIGGANKLAKEIAAKVGGQAVITTATDIGGKPAVDLLAHEIDAVIDSPEKLKTLNRKLAEAEEVYMYSPWPLISRIKAGFKWRQGSCKNGLCCGLYEPEQGQAFLEPAVIISPQKLKLDVNKEWIQLLPRNITVGIGCRKGVSIAEVETAFRQVMIQYYLDEECIKGLATIDIKAREPALQELAYKLGIPLLSFSKEEIHTLDGSYEPSDLVYEKIGVDGVCEPAALLGARRGITIVPKQKIGPVTISVAMEKSWWWDWDLVNGTC